MLSEERDLQLIRGLEKYARAAGLGGHSDYIWKSVKDSDDFDTEDQKIAKRIPNLKSEQACGVIYIDEDTPRICRKFMAMTGLFVRNYLDACYVPMSEVVQILMDGGVPESKILLVPDFCFVNVKGKGNVDKLEPVPGWKRELVYSMLVRRQVENHPTVIAIANTDVLRKLYGHEVMQFLTGNYVSLGDGA